MLTSSPNRRQKGCIPPWVLNVLFICIHALCYHGNPNQIHWPAQLCLIFSSLIFLISSLGSHVLTLPKINRDGAHSQPNLHEFILSLRPVQSMTLFRHPSHFSQLEILENAQRLLGRGDSSWDLSWLGSSETQHPKEFGSRVFTARFTCQIQRRDKSEKVWPLGAAKIHYLSVYTLSPQPGKKQILSLSFINRVHTHTPIFIFREIRGCQWDEPENSH